MSTVLWLAREDAPDTRLRMIIFIMLTHFLVSEWVEGSAGHCLGLTFNSSLFGQISLAPALALSVLYIVLCSQSKVSLLCCPASAGLVSVLTAKATNHRVSKCWEITLCFRSEKAQYGNGRMQKWVTISLQHCGTVSWLIYVEPQASWQRQLMDY